MLIAHDLSFQISGRSLVDGVSLTLVPGDVLAVVGPNGAGKSTLLKLLTGEWRPSGGQIQLDNRPLASWSRHELAQRRAVLLQSSNLAFAFTVLEVVLMGRIPHNQGVESDHDYQIVTEALSAVGLAQSYDRIYHTLSGGEQQRVQLARILAQIWEPPADGERYLLLDEPTSSLDLAYQQQVLAIARRFALAGTAVLVILHDLNLAAQHADRILMLKAGRPMFHGLPNEVLTAENIEKVYDTPVAVLPHPHTNFPLITPIPPQTIHKQEVMI